MKINSGQLKFIELETTSNVPLRNTQHYSVIVQVNYSPTQRRRNRGSLMKWTIGLKSLMYRSAVHERISPDLNGSSGV